MSAIFDNATNAYREWVRQHGANSGPLEYIAALTAELAASQSREAKLREAATEVLIQFKAIMLVWEDKFAPGTADKFRASESALLTALSARPAHEHPGP